MSRHVVVTGGSRGIGAAIARQVLESGGRCTVLDVQPPLCDGAEALHFEHCDVSDAAAVERALHSAEERWGPAEGLAHAAGVLAPGTLSGGELDEASFRHMLEVNLLGCWVVGRAFATRARHHGAGALVFVTSNAATTPRVGMGGYCASKAGAQMIMRCLALELAGQGIRVNAVSPGSTRTPMLEALIGEDPTPAILGEPKSFRLGIPLGRVAEPGDVADAVLFLLSERAKHITGWDLRVDGGATFS